MITRANMEQGKAGGTSWQKGGALLTKVVPEDIYLMGG